MNTNICGTCQGTMLASYGEGSWQLHCGVGLYFPGMVQVHKTPEIDAKRKSSLANMFRKWWRISQSFFTRIQPSETIYHSLLMQQMPPPCRFKIFGIKMNVWCIVCSLRLKTWVPATVVLWVPLLPIKSMTRAYI